MNKLFRSTTHPSPLRLRLASPRASSRFFIICLLALCLTPAHSAHVFAATATPIWSYKPSGDIKWYTMLDTGALLVGTENDIAYLNPETGTPSWTRNDVKKLNQDDVKEIPGTPILLVADSTGAFVKGTRLYAIDVLTGKDIWVSDKLKGSPVAVIPNYEKSMILMVTVIDKRANKDKLDIAAFDIGSGKLLWQNEFSEKVDLYGIERGSKYFPRFDLSGTQPPVFDGDSVYFTYAGLHRFNLADGKLVWKVPYDVTEGSIKRANAAATFDGDTVYTSAKGRVRAIDKASGAVKWTSKDFGGGIAEIVPYKDVLYSRLGGVFYDFGKREYVTKKPLGIAAIDKATGAPVWLYDKAQDSITNIVLLPEQNFIMIADAKNLIGLDTTNTGKIKETFKQKLEFKFSLGTAATVAKVARFGLGGLGGLAKNMSAKGGDTIDEPVLISKQENGTLVIRGKQHLMAFDPRTRTTVWSTKYAAPGVPGWQKIAMTALTIASAAVSTSAESSFASNGNYSAASRQNDSFINSMASYERFMSKRYSASKTTGKYTYVLTDIKDGDDKGAGLVGVNMMTGQGDRQLLFKDKEPEYEVDETTGVVFNLKGNQLSAYKIN